MFPTRLKDAAQRAGQILLNQPQLQLRQKGIQPQHKFRIPLRPLQIA